MGIVLEVQPDDLLLILTDTCLRNQTVMILAGLSMFKRHCAPPIGGQMIETMVSEKMEFPWESHAGRKKRLKAGATQSRNLPPGD